MLYFDEVHGLLSFGFVFDEVAVLGQLADQRIDLVQAQRKLRLALQVAAHEAVLMGAHFERRGAGIVDAGNAVFLGQRQHAQNAAHREHGETAVRRILGVLSLAKKYGVASVDDACAAALEVGSHEYRFVRRYLERQPQLPLSLHQVDPLIRQLTEYRDLIENKTKGE